MRMNMDDIMQQALNITRAQAGVRPMSASEVAAYAAEIAKGIRTILESEPEVEDFESGENTTPACDPKRSMVNFHSKCKILGGVTEFFGKAFLCRFPPENLPRPVVYSVHSLPIQVTLGDS